MRFKIRKKKRFYRVKFSDKLFGSGLEYRKSRFPFHKIIKRAKGKAVCWQHTVAQHYFCKFIIWAIAGVSLYKVGRRLTHEALFEIVWTIFPGVILVLLAIPSIKLLYSMDLILYDYEPIITIKAIGHQWFWSYEYVVFDYNKLSEGVVECKLVNFESYILKKVVSGSGSLRLLEVDNPLVIPTNVYIRFMVTSADVVHSWAVPALGIKVDAVPGRLNQMFTFVKRSGEFYGQCSELCGVNHGFMPIKIVASSVS